MIPNAKKTRWKTKFNVEKGKLTYVGRNNLKYTCTRKHVHENQLSPIRRNGCKQLCVKCQLRAQGS